MSLYLNKDGSVDHAAVPHAVTYRGFLAVIVRDFPSKARAEQWARQVGKLDDAVIEPIEGF